MAPSVFTKRGRVVTDSFPHLFSPLTIGPLTVKNRIFSTGHMTMMIDGGVPNDDFVAYHEARAAGGAGLIITEAARIHASSSVSGLAIDGSNDNCIAAYAKTADAVHGHGCAIFGQLSHGGRSAYGTNDGTRAVAYAPSSTPDERFHNQPRAMTNAMAWSLIDGYGDTAKRMATAGLDGVEILASHGSLPAQFINPRLNLRDDEFGGTFDGRLSFLRELIDNVRGKIGDGVVLGMRISGDEMSHDGLTPDLVIEVIAALEDDGVIDYVNVIAGTMSELAGSVHVVPPMAIETGYVAPFAATVKARVSMPVFVAGRINQPQISEQILSTGQADMCGMTRAMIADPQMAAKAEAGRLDDIRACVGCNQACIGHMQTGYPISCIQHPETGRERTFGTRQPAASSRKVMIAGGGPAGMKAAAVAAERGHDVTLYETSARLGGQIILAQQLPGRAEFGGVITNLTRELEQAGVKVVTNTMVDRAMIDREAPDAVIVATGARPRHPTIEGADEAHVVDAWQVLSDDANVGASVVIADWRCDWVGLGLAEKLARDGCSVKLAVNGTTPGESIQQYVRTNWIGTLDKLGVEIIPYSRLYGVDADTVYLQHTASGEAVLCEGVDTLVTALGHEPDMTLENALQDFGGEFHVIGDCLGPRTVEEAVLEGLKAGAAV
jgi:2,4-dienoyl-CoA reductase-like NADH-dependent reductase (Old Yellow Enzyme family)